MTRAKYSRQILFTPIGAEGQERLLKSKVVIIGFGALGTAQANTLARAGIGGLRIIDRDFVDPTNLQRQMLFDEADAFAVMPKAATAKRKLHAINSDIGVEGIVADVDNRNIEELVRGFDLILDGTDNFQTRYLINDVALKLGIPWIYGAVVASYGVTMTILPARTPCLACVFPKPPEGMHDTCDTVGVIGPAVAWTAAIQVTEAMKVLLGRTSELHGTLMSYDVWKYLSTSITPRIDPICPACQGRDYVHLREGVETHTTLCGRDAVQIRPRESRALDLEALATRLSQFGSVHRNDYLVRTMLDGCELTLFLDGRAIIKGTDDPAVARGIYAKYIGS
ncbi:MAG: ThiF family adenylyltransferase [Terriglobia bacterium]